MSTLTPVTFGLPGEAVNGLQESRVSPQPYTLITEALRQAIAEKGLKLLNEIDVHTALEQAGYQIAGARLMFYFHPNLVLRVLQADWTAMAEAPLKFVVFEQPDGNTVIRWANPANTFSRYGSPTLNDFGEELADLASSIVDAALASLPT